THGCSHGRFSLQWSAHPRAALSFPTRRSSDLTCTPPGYGRRHKGGWLLPGAAGSWSTTSGNRPLLCTGKGLTRTSPTGTKVRKRSEEHTSELQSRENLVCRLLLEKKKQSDVTE